MSKFTAAPLRHRIGGLAAAASLIAAVAMPVSASADPTPPMPCVGQAPVMLPTPPACATPTGTGGQGGTSGASGAGGTNGSSGAAGANANGVQGAHKKVTRKAKRKVRKHRRAARRHAARHHASARHTRSHR